jgi:hypothetical protein
MAEAVMNGYFEYHAVPTNLMRLEGFVLRCAARGGTLFCAGASATGYAGSASTALPASRFRHAVFDILIQRSVFSRHDLRQEPYAVTPLVRIGAGGGQQSPSLPQPVNQRKVYSFFVMRSDRPRPRFFPEARPCIVSFVMLQIFAIASGR